MKESLIPVTKPYLPNRARLDQYIDGIYQRNWLTNNGFLVQELTRRLQDYLEVENLLLVSNGTLALQIAYRALGITESVGNQPAEAITTPFTFVATASSLKWEGVQPVFVDIDPQTWCMNPANIEAAITAQTRALVPVHVFGNSCDVETIQTIANKHKLKVIYDAAHAFGVKYQGDSLLKYGDAATLSFHATKLFHTGEGGAIVFKHKDALERAKKIINFGIRGPEQIKELGINAKMNELQAAMGLCVLDEIVENMQSRARVWDAYEQALGSQFQLQAKDKALAYNHAYFPVLFANEEQVLQAFTALKQQGISARRYFYPSLGTVEYLGKRSNQPISEDIAGRILCLPIYADLDLNKVREIARIIKDGSLCEF